MNPLTRQIKRLKPGLVWVRTDDAESIAFDEQEYEDLIAAGYRFLVTTSDTTVQEIDDDELRMMGLMRVESGEERH